MAKLLAQPALHRKRRNPNWGKPPLPIPDGPTEFGMQLKKLGLTNQTYADSAQLRSWCEYNRNRCYIHESLLKQWGMSVDPDLGS